MNGRTGVCGWLLAGAMAVVVNLPAVALPSRDGGSLAEAVSLNDANVIADSGAVSLEDIVRSCDARMARQTPLTDAGWDNAVYMAGCLDAYRLTGKAAYYDYVDQWCRHNGWRGDNAAAIVVFRRMYDLIPIEYKIADYLKCGASAADSLAAAGDVCRDRDEAAAFGRWLSDACRRLREAEGSAVSETVKGKPRKVSEPRVPFTVTNDTDNNRREVVHIDAGEVFACLGLSGGRQIVVLDGDGVETPYQLSADGGILVAVTVAPHGSARFTIHRGTPRDYRLDCNGHVYPDRLGDLAWENDRSAWRLYGMPMDGSGAGLDIFNKNTPVTVQDRFYHDELYSHTLNDSLKAVGRGKEWPSIYRWNYTYHRNRGLGMDAYTVGMTLGAGAPAVIREGAIVPGTVFEKAEIIENGPVRFKVRLTQRERDGLRETRTITQDLGSHLMRVEVEWNRPEEVAAGIVIHRSQPDAYVLRPDEGYMAYADAMDTPAGQNGLLYIGCIFPDGKEALEYIPLEKEVSTGIGHIVGRRHYVPGETFTYYTGNGWSLYDVPTMSVWEALLRMYRVNIASPLRVTVE